MENCCSELAQWSINETNAGQQMSGECETSVEECSRSEEHTSELQSHSDLVCRLLLEKKKKEKIIRMNPQTVADNNT